MIRTTAGAALVWAMTQAGAASAEEGSGVVSVEATGASESAGPSENGPTENGPGATERSAASSEAPASSVSGSTETMAASPGDVGAAPSPDGETAEPLRPVGPPSYAGARALHQVPDASGGEPYLTRYRPESNVWEVGLFSGLFFPAFDHNLKVAALPYQPYSGTNLTIGARLAYFPLSFLGFEGEAAASPSATRDSNKSALFYAVRGHAVVQLPILSVVPFAVVGGGILGAISEPMGHDGDPAFHFGIGVKAPLARTVTLRLDLRDTLTQQGRGAAPGSPAHHFELLLGATFTFGRAPKTVPIPDLDYDGLYDDEDRCPTLGALTADGCPGGTDSDGDGFLDGDDLCPSEPGAPGSDCPSPTGPTKSPEVPSECPEGQVNSPNGCESPDADGDGLTGAQDACPSEPETKNGYEDGDGCPDAVPEAVKQFTGVIQGISFAKGKSTVDDSSFPVLDSAAEVLRAHPAIRLEVSGHTSSDGPARVNQKLSEQRAQAVSEYLQSRGVSAEQLTVRGAGSSEPIADNATADGRAKNRRIEFRILSQK